MIDLLPFNILVYCIFPYLRDAEMRALAMMNKKINDLIHRYCLADKSSVNDLCQRGDLLIIYKRNLIVRNQRLFYLVCERGYINLVKRTIEMIHFSADALKRLESDRRCNICKSADLTIILMFDCTKYWNDGSHKACKNGFTFHTGMEKQKTSNYWHWGLRGACRGGHRKIVDLMISLLNNNGLNNNVLNSSRIEDWHSGIIEACRGGHCEIIDLMISLLQNSSACFRGWNRELYEACRGGHRETVDLIIEKGADDCIWGLSGACRGGYREIVEMMISLLNNNRLNNRINDKEITYYDSWSWLYNACLSGRREIVDLVITLINDIGLIYHDHWDGGLEGACQGGHRDLVDLMIEKGASKWPMGFERACLGGHREIVELMITLLGDDGCIYNWNQGLYKACQGGHREIVELMITLLNNKCDWDLGLRSACINGHHEIVELMLAKGAAFYDTCPLQDD